GDCNGSYGYNTSSCSSGIVNSPGKTGGGIIQDYWLGTTAGSNRVQSSEGYLVRHWQHNSSWDANLGNSYAMYAEMKAQRLWNPQILTISNWDSNTNTHTAPS